MFRVGILGCENSHAMAFARIFNGYESDYKDEFNDIRVIGAGGDYPEANKKVFDECGLEILAEKPEDLLGKIDAVMVTARDGRRHYDLARPFIEAGIPAFIDKPFTSDPKQAVELVRLAKSRNVPLVGGSSVKLCPDVRKLKELAKANELRGGDVTAPVSMKNDYGDFWFYSAHLAENCIEIFGMPEWVFADRSRGGVTAIAHYKDFDVTNHFTDEAYNYSGTLYTKDEIKYVPIDLSMGYALECREFADMLRHGKMLYSYEQLVAPVFYLSAIEKSFATGEKQYIPQIEL